MIKIPRIGLANFIFLAGLLMASLPSQGASFNCAKASAWVEDAICADSRLSDLDDLLMTSYKKAMSNASNENALKISQRNWLKSVRNSCTDIACLKQAYVSRIDELNQLTATTREPSFAPGISGEYERYYQGKPDVNSANIIIRKLQDGRVYVEGSAIWISSLNAENVRTGELNGSFPLEENSIHYTDGEADGCRLTINLSKNALTVDNDNMRCGGLNVTFDGQYRRIK